MQHYNSTIKVKMGQCIDCPTDSPEKPLVAKRCQYHYKLHQSGIQKRTRQNHPRNQSAAIQRELDNWFAERIRELDMNPYCMECGAFIPQDKRRAAVAHIFPKAIFISVATHRWNYLFLGAGCGCHNRSHRIDTFCKMKRFPMAIQRFAMFKDEITEKHKYLNLFEEQVELFQAYLL